MNSLILKVTNSKFFDKKKLINSLFFLSLLIIFLFISKNLAANDFGLGVAEMLENYLSFVVKIFKYIAGIALIVTVFIALAGRPMWQLGLTFVGGTALIGNLDKVLVFLGLGKGLIF